MTAPTKGNVPELAGSQDAKAKQTDTGNSATNKPEITLEGWLKLSAGAKPSRDRRQKKSWRRAAK